MRISYWINGEYFSRVYYEKSELSSTFPFPVAGEKIVYTQSLDFTDSEDYETLEVYFSISDESDSFLKLRRSVLYFNNTPLVSTTTTTTIPSSTTTTNHQRLHNYNSIFNDYDTTTTIPSSTTTTTQRLRQLQFHLQRLRQHQRLRQLQRLLQQSLLIQMLQLLMEELLSLILVQEVPKYLGMLQVIILVLQVTRF